MARALIDLLWRHHPQAPKRGARGPRSRLSTDALIAAAVDRARSHGLDAVTMRSLAQAVGVSPMSVYTHVENREDMLVLMADATLAAMELPRLDRSWRAAVQCVAETNHDLYVEHPWLLQIGDDRLALGPGCIRKYDHELRAFEGLGLGDVDRDAALTLVLDFTRSAAEARLNPAGPGDFADFWQASAVALTGYLGDDYPLAQRVGAAAGASLGGPYDPAYTWAFGLQRLLDGLAGLKPG